MMGDNNEKHIRITIIFFFVTKSARKFYELGLVLKTMTTAWREKE